MAIKEELQWAKWLAAIVGLLLLLAIWFAIGKWFVVALNGGEPANYRNNYVSSSNNSTGRGRR